MNKPLVNADEMLLMAEAVKRLTEDWMDQSCTEFHRLIGLRVMSASHAGEVVVGSLSSVLASFLGYYYRGRHAEAMGTLDAAFTSAREALGELCRGKGAGTFARAAPGDEMRPLEEVIDELEKNVQ